MRARKRNCTGHKRILAGCASDDNTARNHDKRPLAY